MEDGHPNAPYQQALGSAPSNSVKERSIQLPIELAMAYDLSSHKSHEATHRERVLKAVPACGLDMPNFMRPERGPRASTSELNGVAGFKPSVGL